jgi:putative hydrolase of the HAD superfamily
MARVEINAVVFDIGNVLEANPRIGWPERWATRLAMPRAELEQRLDAIWESGSVGTSTLEEVERQIALALSIDDAALRELMDDVWAEYVGTLNEELAEYFAGLRPRYRTGILSNSFVGAREREQRVHGLGDMCDVVVYSHEAGILKPDPAIYRIVCDRLDVAPERAVLLDDAEANVGGARAIGMHGIVFRTNEQAISDLQVLLCTDVPLPP